MTRLTVFLLACALAASAAANDRDHDRAREAVRRGEAAPLAEILPAVEARLGARVIEVELEREDGRLIYEFELIGPDGRLIDAEVDARTGAVLDVETEKDDD
jgi:uncharacterized membrane protein YkoI